MMACLAVALAHGQDVAPPATAQAVADAKPIVRIEDRPYADFGPFAPAPPLAPPDPTRPDERAVVCDPLSFSEGEPNCGINAQGQPFDTLNGGCGSSFQFFYPLFCDDIVCGTSVYTGAVRDGDWYEITATQQTSFTWEVTPDFDAVIGLAGGTGGVPDCGMVTGITPFKIVPRGETESVTVCVNPGTYWFVVLPNFGQAPFPCGRVYEARITCDTPCLAGGCCVGPFCQETNGRQACTVLGGIYQGDGTACLDLSCTPPFNDECIDAEVFSVGDTLIADLRLATLSSPTEPPNCSQGGGVGSVWFRFNGTNLPVRIESCSSDETDPNASDAIIAVYTGTCGNLTLRRCSDDAGCGATGRQAAVCTAQTLVGTTYYVQVLAWSDSSRGVYTITTSQPCEEPLPPGACCIPTTFGPACAVTTPEECAVFSGVFKGSGMSCPVDPAVLCAGVEVPINDECDGAILLTSGASHTASMNFASSSGTFEDCGLPISGPDLWYRVVGTGRTLTASLCNAVTNFDAQIHVYCDDCFNSVYTCVAANDDAATGACGLSPEVSWCSQNGQNYYIHISGVNGSTGDFRIDFSDDFVVCSGPADCSGGCDLFCPPGAIDENEDVCGPGYVDITNGGCSSSPEVFGVIECGQTICGSSGTFAAGSQLGRDIDWYRFTLTQRTVVTWSLSANFMVETFILNDQCGANIESFGFARGNACQDLSVTATLDPGTYSILVSPQFFQGVSCNNATWYGTLDCTPTPDNGACCIAVDTCIETTEANCIELGGGYAADGVACNTVTCDAPPSGCPGDFNGDNVVNSADFVILAGNFGTTSGATSSQGDANGDGAVNAADFVILAGNFGNDCGPVGTVGACCTSFTTCIQVTQAQCASANGDYAGNGTLCAGVDCDPCPADFNGDDLVTAADFVILAGNYGTTSGASRTMGDATLDGAVNASDFTVLAGALGQPCA
jgi:hypothetical protein